MTSRDYRLFFIIFVLFSAECLHCKRTQPQQIEMPSDHRRGSGRVLQSANNWWWEANNRSKGLIVLLYFSLSFYLSFSETELSRHPRLFPDQTFNNRTVNYPDCLSSSLGLTKQRRQKWKMSWRFLNSYKGQTGPIYVESKRRGRTRRIVLIWFRKYHRRLIG